MSKFKTRAELVTLAKEVFERENMHHVNSLLALQDGQLFVPTENAKSNVMAHAKQHNMEYFEITRAEAVNGETPKSTAPGAKEPVKMTKAELVAFGSKLGLELLDEQTKADMLAVIKAKQEESAGAAESGEGTQE
jgi:glucose/arabinose dehydrogenase